VGVEGEGGRASESETERGMCWRDADGGVASAVQIEFGIAWKEEVSRRDHMECELS